MTKPIVAVLAVSVAVLTACSPFRDDYSYGKGRDYSDSALAQYRSGGAPSVEDACRQALKFYLRFGALGTGRDDPPKVDPDDFKQGCLDGMGG